MTEREICLSYREAKNRSKQIPVIADLSGVSRTEIIGILLKNGESVEQRDIGQLYRRLNALEMQIEERTKEYKKIAQILYGNGKEHAAQGRR